MDYKELNGILSELNQAILRLEDAYLENGGEVTEETQQQEDYISGLQSLITDQGGIDLLGEWLKAKEDKAKALKAEKAYVDSKIKANNESIDFVKTLTTKVMSSCGLEKAKGNLGYSFTAYNSVETKVDKEILNGLYLQKVQDALKDILPFGVSVELKASVKAVEDYQFLPDYYIRTETPSVRFAKPRAAKED